MPHQPVRVARTGLEVDRHQELAGLAVGPVQAGFPLRVAAAVVAGDDPDVPFVVERHVVESRFLAELTRIRTRAPRSPDRRR